MRDLLKKCKKYSFGEILKLLFFITYTKVIIPNARIIRYPIDIRGRKNIEFGKKFAAGYHCRIETHASSKEKVLIIGQNVQINDFVHIAAKQSVVIGNNVLIASKVFISDISHGSYNGDIFDSEPETDPQKRKLVSKPVSIDENVWIGESVSILPGVRIGKASIIGANSVVTKDIPDYCIAAGNPAKVIKRYNFNTGRWEKVSC
jgi:acetyltransferase-like isoleucine patch superfamily enzyme